MRADEMTPSLQPMPNWRPDFWITWRTASLFNGAHEVVHAENEFDASSGNGPDLLGVVQRDEPADHDEVAHVV